MTVNASRVQPEPWRRWYKKENVCLREASLGPHGLLITDPDLRTTDAMMEEPVRP